MKNWLLVPWLIGDRPLLGTPGNPSSRILGNAAFQGPTVGAKTKKPPTQAAHPVSGSAYGHPTAKLQEEIRSCPHVFTLSPTPIA